MSTQFAHGMLAVSSLLVVGCGSALPDVLVLRVDTVRVAETRIGSEEPWDGPMPETDPAAGCRVMAAGVQYVEPLSGSFMSALCGLALEPQREQAPTSPDIRVRLSAGAKTTYESFTTRDTTGTRLAYEFVVPVDAVPSDGLRLDVVDSDGTEAAELIGGVRLTPQQLDQAYASPSKLLTLSSDGVAQLEVVLSPYSPQETISETHRASDRPFQMGRAVKAGELVSVRASGHFKVGSWYDHTVSPVGYPGGEARSYNLGPFKKEPHACAIVLIGRHPIVEGVAVGAAKAFVARHAGPLRIGLNDSEPDNNEGTVDYQLSLRAPTPEEWLAGSSTR